MPHHESDGSRRATRLVAAAGLLVAGALAGGITAATLSASAADDGGSTAATAATTSTTQPTTRPDRGDPRGPTPVRSDEKALTDAVAAKVRAVALKAVPGGTVYRVETDADGATYEAHMTRSDGSFVTVKLDASFAVTATESGMGGDGHGASRGPDRGDSLPPSGSGRMLGA